MGGTRTALVEMATSAGVGVTAVGAGWRVVKLITLNRAEWMTALLLTGLVLILLIVRAQHAGALWRDECASVQLALMPTLQEILHNFQRESFPVAFALLLRGYTSLCGTSDAAFRVFGLLIGVMTVGILWINARLLSDVPPLLSLTLIGLNTTFLVWGTGVRGYGIGSAVVLLAFGMFGNALLQLNGRRFAAALLAAVASVHLLLYNSVLLIAIAAGATMVCLARGTRKLLMPIGGIALASALSVCPYIGPFRHEAESTIIFGGPVSVGWLWEQLRLALGTPSGPMTTVWILLFLLTVTGGVLHLCRTSSQQVSPGRDLMLFGLVVSVASAPLYFAFLKIVSYRTRDWYYLALIAILAGSIELVTTRLVRKPQLRVARLAFVIAAAIGLPFVLWPKLIERQTNVNLVAGQLEEIAQTDDLIVVNPWFYGISFNWYYHGPTRWVTLPILTDHRLHRFDLLKAKMMSRDPITDVQELIADKLKSGRRVWFAGGVTLRPPGEVPLPLPPAPLSEFGWSLDAYDESWSEQIGFFLRQHALTGQFIRIPSDHPVNELESVSLLVMDGWRE
jgi:hypothetical protein